MELRDIEIFLVLAQELHFGRTAERLRITPSRVSHVIKKTERRVGAPLFARTSRTVRLTPLGERLRDDLLPAHRQIQQAVDRAVAEARGITGTLRVGYSTPWCADLLLKAARTFRDRYADCTVQIQEIQLSDPHGSLRRGDLDLQLSELPVAEPGITVGPTILSEQRALLVPADHPLARRENMSMEDLVDVPLMTPGGSFPDYMAAVHLPTHTPSGRAIRRGPVFTYWAEVLSLVAAGLGAFPVSARGARYFGWPGIAFVPFRDAPPIEYGLLWPTSGHTPRAMAFADLLGDLTDTAASDE
ncbi:LysR family transcriptional regulator [Actinomadura sp. CNU-125]|uniref:LysR family transcriptional regulator n=1 Tax=Actinomadura sp. CNU-125 TaxID=1904961 RepID=UPI00096007AE|nr:LysR family transcriptional regulator [Actinomadura sp. CNU-125]OLT33218.1 LysR family transcriptional regulator [Actinomadura sp. CNU-125]